jgi:hypothetical protein
MAAGGGIGPIAAVSAFVKLVAALQIEGLRSRSSRNQVCLRGWLSSTPLSVWQVNAT